tara:strand:+ start:1479 stop:1799 length:321 start_codon:yes stop_codon:yes gene_type:complete
MNRIFFVNSSKKRDGRTLIHQKTVERIKRLRSMGELSQAEIAKKLGWASASYSDIESYNKKLDLDKLSEIATFFDVTIGFLTEGLREGISKERLEQIENSIEFMKF